MGLEENLHSETRNVAVKKHAAHQMDIQDYYSKSTIQQVEEDTRLCTSLSALVMAFRHVTAL